MNANQFTQKTLAALEQAQSLAREHGNQQLEQAHMLLALLEQENGLIPQLLLKAGIDPAGVDASVRGVVERLPKVTGTDQVYLGRELEQALQEAERQSKRMQDEYISVEHVFLGI